MIQYMQNELIHKSYEYYSILIEQLGIDLMNEDSKMSQSFLWIGKNKHSQEGWYRPMQGCEWYLTKWEKNSMDLHAYFK